MQQKARSLAAVAQQVKVPAAAIVPNIKLRAIAIRGLTFGDDNLSRMDILADALNKIPGVACKVESEGLLNYENLSSIEAELLAWARAGSQLGIIGHSMGADEVWKLAALLEDRNIKIAVAASIDPTNWDQPLGGWPVPATVAAAGNFYQDFPPGGGQIVLAPGNTTTMLYQERRADPHVGIERDPVIKWIVDQIGAQVPIA